MPAILRLWKSMRFCLAWANGVEHLSRPYKECQRGAQKNRHKKIGRKIAGIRFMTLIFVMPSIFRLMAKIRREPTQVISAMTASPRKGDNTEAASVIGTW